MMTSEPEVSCAAVVLATSNAGKLAEIREILVALPLQIRPLSDFPGVILPDEGEVTAIGTPGEHLPASGEAQNEYRTCE